MINGIESVPKKESKAGQTWKRSIISHTFVLVSTLDHELLGEFTGVQALYHV